MTRSVVISEVFGPTFQGEGRSIGMRCGFVRFGRCNLDCGRGPGASWHCDTPFTWDWERFDPATELRRASVDEIIAELEPMKIERVVVTGGEPLLQQSGLVELVDAVTAKGWSVEIETNGTIEPTPRLGRVVDQFNVSLKMANSGVSPERALCSRSIAALRATGRAVFKFVVASIDELDAVHDVVTTHQLDDVWIMPAGTSAAEVVAVSRAIADEVLERGWNMTTRLHVLLWGDERGR